MGGAPRAAIYPEQNLTAKILEAAFAVHNTLGCGFLNFGFICVYLWIRSFFKR
jgi:hypothetical protein